MNKTNNLVVAGGVNGNIGSCSIVSTNISKGAFTVETMAVNSCTGEIVSHTDAYFDSSWIAIPVIIIFLFLGIRILFD